MSTMSQPLLFSLKPNYAELIFKGLKKVELRRRIASNMENRYVFVYVSSPVKQLRGGFRVGQVWSGDPEEIWNKVSNLSQVTKQYFDIYYEGRNIAYALEITDVWEYENPPDLNGLRERFPNFIVPQSWRAVSPEELRSFGNMKYNTSSPPPSAVSALPTKPLHVPSSNPSSKTAPASPARRRPPPQSISRIYTAPDHGYNENATNPHNRQTAPCEEEQD